MICLPLLFVNNTTQTLQCVCSWIPAQKNRVLLIWPWMTLKILLNPWLAHTLGSISPNKSTEFWSFLSDPLTQLLKEKKKKVITLYHQKFSSLHNTIYVSATVLTLCLRSPVSDFFRMNQGHCTAMQLTWNQTWICQILLSRLYCPPQWTPQTPTPACHTTLLLQVAW